MVTTNNIPAQKAIDHFLHSTGSKSLGLDHLDVLNMVGDHFVNAYKWRYLRGANAFLSGRGNISLSTATWTESSLTLTATGAFADYTFIDEDLVKITGGTSTTAKYYEIASRTDDDNIVLAETLSTTGGNLAAGDIAGTLHLPTLELPDDFGTFHSIAGADTLVNSIGMVDATHLGHLRAQWDREDNTGFYSGCLIHVGTPPRSVLDVHPYFSSNIEDVFRIYYTKSWTRITQASQTLPIPRYCNGAFMQLCRHFALGWEDEDVAGLEARLAAWEDGALFKQACDQDRRQQSHYGRMRGGAVRRTPHKIFPNSLSSEVAGPT